MTIQFLPQSLVDDIETMSRYVNTEYLDAVMVLPESPLVSYFSWDDAFSQRILRSKMSGAKSRIKSKKSYAHKTPVTKPVDFIERLSSFSPKGLPIEMKNDSLRVWDCDSDLFGGKYDDSVLLPSIINQSLRLKGNYQLTESTKKWQLKIRINGQLLCFGSYNSKLIAQQSANVIIQHYRKKLVMLYSEHLHPDIQDALINYQR